MAYSEFRRDYRRCSRRKILVISIVLVMTIAAAILKIPLGPYDIDFIEAYRVLIRHILGMDAPNHLDDYVIWEENLPRVITVVVVGAGLGVCGTAMQSTLKNPLADPYITGISSGAGLGISLGMISGIFIVPGLTGDLGYISNAFILSLIPASMILIVSSLRRDAGPTTMILIGIAVMYLFGACTTMLKLTASEESYAEVFAWSLGTIGRVDWQTLPILIAASSVGIIILCHLSIKLNLLSNNDALAKSTGLNVKWIRMFSILVVALVTATLVCFSGTIGFVGLVAPHVMRIFLGSDNRYLLPASAVSGAFILTVADCIATEITPAGMPVGVITSLVGGPLFIYILINQHKKTWT